MGKIQIVFVAICVLAGLSWINPNSRTLTDAVGQRIVRTAETQIGVREKSGKNDGAEVESYLAYVHLPKGNPWCAAFVSWVFGRSGYREPRTAWSPGLFPSKRLARSFTAGTVYGLYSSQKGRIVHCGITRDVDGDWIMGIEGNTNMEGSVEGDGVYAKRRHRRMIKLVADWTGGGRR